MRRPFPIGAVFLILVVVAVLGVILWPSRRDRTPPLEPGPTSGPAAVVLEPGTRVEGLADRLRLLLLDRRLDVRAGTGAADLLCRVPPGRSLFSLNGELSRAVRLWGGRVVGGREGSSTLRGRWVDLRFTLRGETCAVRLRNVPPPEGAPRVAVVIDDFGYLRAGRLEEFLALPFPFTPSVLPGLDRSLATLRRILEAGRSPILHLPMEPLDGERFDPGPGALRVGMSEAEVREQVARHLDEMEGVIGVSHHMGSRGSAERSLVGPALDTIGERGLFYVDSMTSDSTVCPAEAAARGVRCLSADLFLDGEGRPSRETMLRNLRKAAELARTNGDAIVIGHARPATLRFLPSVPESLSAWGCRLVPLEELLR